MPRRHRCSGRRRGGSWRGRGEEAPPSCWPGVEVGTETMLRFACRGGGGHVPRTAVQTRERGRASTMATLLRFFGGKFLTGVQSNRVLSRPRLRRPQGECICIGSRNGDHPEDRSFITLTSKLKQGAKKPERGNVPQHVTRVGPGGVSRKFHEQAR